MPFGTPVVGTTAYSAQNGTSVAPTYPASIVSTDQLVLILGMKPSTANGGSVTTPTGWTLRESLTAAGGYGTTLGADTGNTNLYIYTKDTVTGSESGTLSVTVATNNVCWANITRVPTGGGIISYGSADGQRTTTPTSPLSVALADGSPATAFAAGDFAIWAMCIPTDVTTPAQFSAHTITSSGATFNATAELVEPDSGTGNDIGGYVAWVTVSTGTAGGAPTVGATLAGTLTNVRGPLALLRMRETPPPERTGSLSVTESGSDTASGSVVITPDEATGSLSAQEAGSDTANASVTAPGTALLAVQEVGSDSFAASATAASAVTAALSENGPDLAAVEAAVLASVVSVAQEQDSDNLIGVSSVEPNQSSSSMGAVETGSDALTGSAASVVSGSMPVMEQASDSLTGQGVSTVAAQMATTEAAREDIFVGQYETAASGVLLAIEVGGDIADGVGIFTEVSTESDAAISESGPDTFSASVSAPVTVLLGIEEAGGDVASAGAVAVSSATLAVSEAGFDTLISPAGLYAPDYMEEGYSQSGQVGNVLVQASMVAQENAPDALAAEVITAEIFYAAVVEGGSDVASATGQVVVGASMATQETGIPEIQALLDAIWKHPSALTMARLITEGAGGGGYHGDLPNTELLTLANQVWADQRAGTYGRYLAIKEN